MLNQLHMHVIKTVIQSSKEAPSCLGWTQTCTSRTLVWYSATCIYQVSFTGWTEPRRPRGTQTGLINRRTQSVYHRKLEIAGLSQFCHWKKAAGSPPHNYCEFKVHAKIIRAELHSWASCQQFAHVWYFFKIESRDDSP